MYFNVVRLIGSRDIIEGADFEFQISYFFSLYLYCVNLSISQLEKKKN
jgi:hypothetical protein